MDYIDKTSRLYWYATVFRKDVKAKKQMSICEYVGNIIFGMVACLLLTMYAASVLVWAVIIPLTYFQTGGILSLSQPFIDAHSVLYITILGASYLTAGMTFIVGGMTFIVGMGAVVVFAFICTVTIIINAFSTTTMTNAIEVIHEYRKARSSKYCKTLEVK